MEDRERTTKHHPSPSHVWVPRDSTHHSLNFATRNLGMGRDGSHGSPTLDGSTGLQVGGSATHRRGAKTLGGKIENAPKRSNDV